MRTKTKWIVVHSSMTKPTEDIGLKELDRKHRASGFFGVRYHLIIRRNGTVEEGRPIDSMSPHLSEERFTEVCEESVSVCLIGGLSKDGKPVNNYTAEQNSSARQIIQLLLKRYPEAQAIGHHDLNNETPCPCCSVKYLTEKPR